MRTMLIAVTSRNKVVNDLPAYYVIQEYLDALEDCNAEYLIVTPNRKQDYSRIVDFCDGLLLCGGSDVNPHFYNEANNPANRCANEVVDIMDFKLIEAFQQKKKPILGICRGMQVINTYFNGTLTQDIPSLIKTKIAHSQEMSRNLEAHTVTTQPNSVIRDIIGEDLKVNSFHHQCVNLPGDHLHVSAYSEDGLIEAIEGPFILGVQWHPESMKDEQNKAIFKYFIKQCKEKNYV